MRALRKIKKLELIFIKFLKWSQINRNVYIYSNNLWNVVFRTLKPTIVYNLRIVSFSKLSLF